MNVCRPGSPSQSRTDFQSFCRDRKFRLRKSALPTIEPEIQARRSAYGHEVSVGRSVKPFKRIYTSLEFCEIVNTVKEQIAIV